MKSSIRKTIALTENACFTKATVF